MHDETYGPEDTHGPDDDLEKLVQTWRGYLRRHGGPAGDDNTRDAGFRSALQTCADQLAETLARMDRADV
jgi:hypothetical protein